MENTNNEIITTPPTTKKLTDPEILAEATPDEVVLAASDPVQDLPTTTPDEAVATAEATLDEAVLDPVQDLLTTTPDEATEVEEESVPMLSQDAMNDLLQNTGLTIDSITTLAESPDAEPLVSFESKKVNSIAKCEDLDKHIHNVVEQLKNITSETMGLKFALEQIFMKSADDEQVVKCENLVTDLITFLKGMDPHHLTTGKLSVLVKFASNNTRLDFLDQAVKGLDNAFNKFDLFVSKKKLEFSGLEADIMSSVTDESFVNGVVSTTFANSQNTESENQNIDSDNVDSFVIQDDSNPEHHTQVEDIPPQDVAEVTTLPEMHESVSTLSNSENTDSGEEDVRLKEGGLIVNQEVAESDCKVAESDCNYAPEDLPHAEELIEFDTQDPMAQSVATLGVNDTTCDTDSIS
ncbi:MAG: hypothetical protein EB127_05275 [Alphaproteobacteria bacterium]|nr:hypothetical protein [Alphaproteobacteria bacterium]